MLKFKTLTKAAQNKDISKFQDSITKYGQVIFDKLDVLKGNSNIENLYFLLLTNLWNEKENITEHIALFDDYIDFKLNSIKQASINLKLEKNENLLSLSDININLEVLKERKINYLNELVINYISNTI
ncbi:MAG: hypothetical protein ACRDCW_10790 [Sarcina sp.]